MIEDLQLLIELQKSDSDAARIKIKKKELPERIARLDQAFQIMQQKLEDFRVHLEDLRSQYREREDKLRQGQDGLKKARERLELVKNNKEYQAILKEIDSMEKKNGDVESEIIGLFDAIDKENGELEQREKDFAGESNAYQTNRNKLELEMKSLDESIAECQARNGRIRGSLGENLIRKYEAIRNLHRDVAVVSVWKGVCNGCHMNIPPQMYNELQKTTVLMSCPHCNRIIYWQNEEENS
ncbi:MAG: C4-type zinc ribbon domain-containing protein [Syntrophales bacterium]|nr:C4-type zinc ribbon domain-containing protein [Syntrophales bacterium]